MLVKFGPISAEPGRILTFERDGLGTRGLTTRYEERIRGRSQHIFAARGRDAAMACGTDSKCIKATERNASSAPLWSRAAVAGRPAGLCKNSRDRAPWPAVAPRATHPLAGHRDVVVLLGRQGFCCGHLYLLRTLEPVLQGRFW